MKKLLLKEIKLTASPCSYIFLLFTFMVFIPSYPITICSFFVCYGIFFTYQSGRENQDLLYTLMLPIEKSQVVKAKYLFVVLIQTIAFVILTLFVLVRVFLLNQVQIYKINQLVNGNFTFLGYVLIIFTVFNACLTGYFKSGYNLGVPFLIFSIIAFVFVVIFEVLHHLPGLGVLNAVNFTVEQLIPLGIGIVTYTVGTLISLKVSIKGFEKVDF